MSDVVIVGAGQNGLTAAFYLARAGLKPLVLERLPYAGGGAITGSIHPGFQGPALSHEVLLHAGIARDMDLERRGVAFLDSPVHTCALSPDGRAIPLYRDPARTAGVIRPASAADADAIVQYTGALQRLMPVIAAVLEAPPPSLGEPGARDIWNLLRAGRRFRALERRDEYRLLRSLPMPVADLMDEWFQTDLLRAAVAAPGLSGTMLGPRSAGSSLVLLLRETHRRAAGGLRSIKGGPGALTRAMQQAATDAGAEIHTGCPVERLIVRDAHVAGVVAGGREIPARTVVSGVDPRTTFLRLIDPVDLSPDFAAKIRNYRSSGTVAKINLALSALPNFSGVPDSSWLTGHIHLGPDLDYLERAFDHAKYGEYSREPWLDVTIPSMLDPQLAPAGAHVASIYAHCAPYRLRETSWDTAAQPLLRAVLNVLERHAPGIGALVVEAQVITPADLESVYGFSGGHIFHGELAPDQLFAMRPVLGYGTYDTPIRGLFLCGGGTHPGGFATGISGRLAAREVLRRRRI